MASCSSGTGIGTGMHVVVSHDAFAPSVAFFVVRSGDVRGKREHGVSALGVDPV